MVRRVILLSTSRERSFWLPTTWARNTVALPIGKDGSLAPICCEIKHEGSSVNKRRQEAPHAHSINLDAANQFAFAADLGIDKVLVFRFAADGGDKTLQPVSENETRRRFWSAALRFPS